MPSAPLPGHAQDRYLGPCATQAALGVLAGKWAAPVIGRLARGGARFRQLQDALRQPDGRGVSSKVLSAELRRLASAGVLTRDTDGAGVRYALTEPGRQLVPLLDALGHWAESSL